MNNIIPSLKQYALDRQPVLNTFGIISISIIRGDTRRGANPHIGDVVPPEDATEHYQKELI